MTTPLLKALTLCSLLTIVCLPHAKAADSSTAKMVECDGNTLIKVDDRIGAQTQFHAIFSIEGDTVTMVEGDSTRFSNSYKASEELTKPGRPGYGSANGNLFFFKTSGRFEIFKMEVTSSGGLKSETTEGQCKSFTPSDVFK